MVRRGRPGCLRVVAAAPHSSDPLGLASRIGRAHHGETVGASGHGSQLRLMATPVETHERDPRSPRSGVNFPSGGEGTRTLDLRLAKPPLFQLSYTPGAIASAGLLYSSSATPSYAQEGRPWPAV